MARLTDSQRELARRYVPLAVRAGQRAGRRLRLAAPHDLTGAAFLGLCRAALHFEDRGINFATYARSMIDGEIGRELRRILRAREDRQLDTRSLASDPLPIDDEALWSALQHLTPFAREAVIRIYGYEQTVSEAAEAMRASRHGVHRSARQALDRLRQILAD